MTAPGTGLPPAVVVVAALVGSACGGAAAGNDDLATEIADLRASMDQRSADLDEVEADVAALVRGVAAVVDRYDQAIESLRRATAEFEQATEQFDEASIEFRAASETFEDVAEGYRVAAIALIVIAGADVVGDAMCGNRMSTQAYRAELRSQGYNLEGLDVDHIIPRSLGGPDNPMNYQLLDSSLNRSLGAGGLLDKFVATPLPFLAALATTAVSALACP